MIPIGWRSLAGAVLGLVALPSLVLAQAAAPLDVPAKSIIAAPREGRIVILVDVNAHKAWLLARPEDARKAALVATATHYALQTLQSGKFDAKLTDAEVIVAMIENMDEYNRPNFGGMVRLGTVTVRRAGDKVEVVAETIQPGLVK
jgi:hypothetical protein